MSNFDVLRRESDRAPTNNWRKITRWLRRRVPTGLYARSLLIIILPMVILQSVVAYVFMERHWQMVTERLSTAVTRDIAAIIDVINTYPQDADHTDIIRIASQRMNLNISIEPKEALPPPRPKPFFSILDQILSDQIIEKIHRPFWIDTVGDSNLVEIRVQLDEKILRVYAPRSQAYASNTEIFLMWMVGTALVLIAIATLFLRGQIRPILALARAAESFGKGQRLPESFSPRGADEVRRAGMAFIQMRERIERQIEQRTAMLTGVSHDLRTILTRFRLQLELLGEGKDVESLHEDISDMQKMLEGYMAFAKGESGEDVGTLKLSELLAKVELEAELLGKTCQVSMEGDDVIEVRPNAFHRLLTNITSNAFAHADHIIVDARHSAKWLVITIDDNGPGIPEDRREDVFKPFFRLDEARNLNASGTGLGLAIARDIARGHGGNITLSDSPIGGLRAVIRVPA